MFAFFGIEFLKVFDGHYAEPAFNELGKTATLATDVQVSRRRWLAGYVGGTGVVEWRAATWTVEFEVHGFLLRLASIANASATLSFFFGLRFAPNSVPSLTRLAFRVCALLRLTAMSLMNRANSSFVISCGSLSSSSSSEDDTVEDGGDKFMGVGFDKPAGFNGGCRFNGSEFIYEAFV